MPSIDQLFVHHLNRDAHCGLRGALAVAGLQHEELATLNSELHVLHVAEVMLKTARDFQQLFVNRGKSLFERREMLSAFGLFDLMLPLPIDALPPG